MLHFYQTIFFGFKCYFIYKSFKFIMHFILLIFNNKMVSYYNNYYYCKCSKYHLIYCSIKDLNNSQ